MLALPPTLYAAFLLLTAAEGEAAQPASTCPPPFVAGETLERSLAAGRAEIVFDLDAARYIRLKIDQSNADVKVTVYGPGGKKITERDGPGPLAELASWVTAETGEYRLVMEIKAEGAERVVTPIVCEEHRVTRPKDADRVAAELALSSSIQLEVSGLELDHALALAKESRLLWEKAGDRAQELEALLETGFIQLALRQPLEATASLHEALSMARADGYGGGEVRALRSLAFIHLEVEGDAESALMSSSEALRVARALADSELTANVLEMIGVCQFRLERNQLALNAYREALALAAPGGATEARLWNAIGAVHTRMGASGEALSCHERALAIATKNGDLGTKAAALTSVGLLRGRRGELQRALDCLVEARAINQKLGDTGSEAMVLTHLGGVLLELGEAKQALDQFAAALATDRLRDGWKTLTHINIAHTRLVLGQPEQALNLLNGVLVLGTNDARTRALALRSRGAALLKVGRSQEALASLFESLPLWRDAGDRLGEAFTLLEAGWTLKAMGRAREAQAKLQDARGLAQIIDAWYVQTSALHALAILERDGGDLVAARRYIEAAMDILRSVRSTLPSDRLRSSFVASKRGFYEFYIDILMRLGDSTEAFEASEAARARSLLDLLAEGRVDVTRGISEELKDKERDVDNRLAAAQLDLSYALGQKTPDPARIESLKKSLEDVVAERDRLGWRIRGENPRYANVRYPLTLKQKEIQDRLPLDTALIEYWLGADGSYVFVLTRDGAKALKLPARNEIADQVERASNGVKSLDHRATSSYISAARWLYNSLLAPILPALAGKNHWIISPDGALHSLAFETLLTSDPVGPEAERLPYLVQEVALSYIPSASVLFWLSSGQDRSPGLRFVAFADPVYGPRAPSVAQQPTERGALPDSSALPPLKGTEQEVRAIAEQYLPEEVKLFLQESANQRNVTGHEVATAQRIHFAAHGFLNQERPELSGLALTRTDAPGDDGLLQVFEIFNLDLSAQLVVLSACETGGTVVAGEGLVGLARAFLYAGAPTVVVSLWRIRDDSAPKLMVQFYRALDQHGDAAAALREAKRALIAGGLAQPYYWAPFILVGESR